MILVAASAFFILAGGVAAAALSRRPHTADRAFRLLFAVGCVLGALPAIAVLQGASVGEFRFNAAIPGGAWVFGLDALSAVFVLTILGVGAASAFYGVTYLSPEREHRAVGVAHLLVAVLTASLLGVVTARAAVPFLIAWESMAITAYLLVVFEHEHRETRRAGLLYLVASHAATLALLGMFAGWGSSAGDLTFASLAERAPSLPAGGAGVLMLALLGFGLKAGIVPLHFWLPEAHAAAPSHVSALMSGVVIKIGIYGLFRVVVLIGSPPAWWGWLLLGLGAASGILGVIWALAQHDLKRLLAFHSVENIGIILLGLGAGVLGVAYERPVVAVLGFAGAALHVLNHALFKSLLFLGAGSVARATGTRDIDRLGGLTKRMPETAAAFLIGSAAIVGLPPLNGFVSEWLVFRSLLESGLGVGVGRLAVLGGAALGLIGALALACFAKVVGIVFLGSARGTEAESAREAPRGMLGPMFALAGACVVIGLLPVLVLRPFLRVGELLAGTPSSTAVAQAAAGPVTLFALAVTAGLFGAWSLRTHLMARRPASVDETWACGYDHVTARMQYTASSFAQPILTAYRPIAGVHIERSPDVLATHAVDPALGAVLLPAWRAVRRAAVRIRSLERGRLPLLLGYLALTLVVLLIYLLLAGPT